MTAMSTLTQDLIALKHGENASDGEKDTADRALKAVQRGEFDRASNILHSGGFKNLSRRVLDEARRMYRSIGR